MECMCYREYENVLSHKLQNIDCISQQNLKLYVSTTQSLYYIDEEIEFLKNLKNKLFVLIYAV